MSDIAISARELSKAYRIAPSQDRPTYRTLREDVLALPRHLWSVARHRSTQAAESFWALDRVSFEVRQGELVGIIGRNGAGKSTLLKLLSRITEPTRGEADIYGRVGTLLEVGTGFHPELTGRENIYLSGAVLGMRRHEIARRFAEIVEFAEVERFVDTPVKRYSSGMYMRLAFSVAAHLDPDILIVDEVLAVGDASFQRKCLSKMEDVGHQGRTVLFVSHSMPAVTRLCERALLLHQGCILEDGPAHRVAGGYLRSGLGTTAAREWPELRTAPGNDVVRFRAVRVRNGQGQIADAVDIRRPVSIELEYDVLAPGHTLVPNINLTNEDGTCIFAAVDLDPRWHRRSRPPGRYLSTAHLPGDFLAEGVVAVRALVSTFDPMVTHADVPDAVALHVTDSVDGDSARGDYAGFMPGIVRPRLTWSNELIGEGSTGRRVPQVSLL
jgi:lipopolysaccharide transport system ATP-binding protein